MESPALATHPDDVERSPNIAQPEDEIKLWEYRERKMFIDVDRQITYYSDLNNNAYRWHQVLSVSIMIGGAITPVFIAGGSSETTFFNIPAGILSSFAIVLTISMAVMEGLRRIYRFDQRWISCFTAKRALRRARENYRFKRIGLAIGSADWKQNLAEMRQTVEAAWDKESEQFMDGLKQVSAADAPKVPAEKHS